MVQFQNLWSCLAFRRIRQIFLLYIRYIMDFTEQDLLKKQSEQITESLTSHFKSIQALFESKDAEISQLKVCQFLLLYFPISLSFIRASMLS